MLLCLMCLTFFLSFFDQYILHYVYSCISSVQWFPGNGSSSSPYQDGLWLIPTTYCTSAIFRAMKTRELHLVSDGAREFTLQLCIRYRASCIRCWLASMMQPCIFLQLLALHLFPKYREDHNSQQLNTAQTGTEHPALPNVNTEKTKWKHSLRQSDRGRAVCWWEFWHKGRNVWNHNSS